MSLLLATSGAQAALVLDSATRLIRATAGPLASGDVTVSSSAGGVFDEQRTRDSGDARGRGNQNTDLEVQTDSLVLEGSGFGLARRNVGNNIVTQVRGVSRVDLVLTVDESVPWSLSGDFELSGEGTGSVLFEEVGGPELLSSSTAGAFSGSGTLAAGQYHFFLQGRATRTSRDEAYRDLGSWNVAFAINHSDAEPMPEPETAALLFVGIGVMSLVRHFRRRPDGSRVD
ncbi:MAG: PEP-CTERM sorting domain-containing protein [Alphaproteobacteria bacterium]